MDVEAGKLEECGFWREWCDSRPGHPQRVILRCCHKDRSLRKVTGDKITLQKTVAFLGMKKSEGEKKKENETLTTSGEKKKEMRTGQPYQILEHARKPQ